MNRSMSSEYDYAEEFNEGGVSDKTALVVYTSSNPRHPLVEPIEADLRQVKRGRKSKTYVAGISFGVLLLVLLGPIGGVAGGIAGAFAAKSALKRREKMAVDRLVAMRYPLVYNENAVFA
jgi:hypothetical protein